jgi:hypothetical protein
MISIKLSKNYNPETDKDLPIYQSPIDNESDICYNVNNERRKNKMNDMFEKYARTELLIPLDEFEKLSEIEVLQLLKYLSARNGYESKIVVPSESKLVVKNFNGYTVEIDENMKDYIVLKCKGFVNHSTPFRIKTVD